MVVFDGAYSSDKFNPPFLNKELKNIIIIIIIIIEYLVHWLNYNFNYSVLCISCIFFSMKYTITQPSNN